MHLCKGDQSGPISPMHHAEVKIEENVIDTTVPECSVGLTKDSMNAIATLQKPMYSVCSLNNIDFCMLVEEEEIERSEAHDQSVDFVLALPLHNISCVQGEGRSNLDILACNEMKSTSNLCSLALRPEAHEQIFCSPWQFEHRYRVLSKEAHGQEEMVNLVLF